MVPVPQESPTTEQVLTMLAAGPPRIAALTDGVPTALLQTRPAPGEWSANEVLAHLRACADMWGKYIMAMLAEERPTLRTVSPRTWINRTDYLEQAFQPSFRAFATQRAELLALLEPLPPAGWSRAAIMTGAGKAREQTVLSYAQSLALHERPHVKQIERIVSTLHQEQ
jgi:hypothetical protein